MDKFEIGQEVRIVDSNETRSWSLRSCIGDEFVISELNEDGDAYFYNAQGLWIVPPGACEPVKQSLKKIDIKILDERLLDNLPKYATSGSAAMDLRVCADCEYNTLGAGQTRMFKTGIAIHVNDPGYVALIVPRSSMGKKGIRLANTVGVIDSDYQGEIGLNLHNFTDAPVVVENMERVAQLMIVPVLQVEWNVVKEFSSETKRGAGAFGSTGKS